MSEGKLRDQTARANAAQRILNDDVFRDAIDVLRNAIQRNFSECDVADSERLMRIKMMDETVTLFIQNFETALKKGRIASESLINLEKERKWQNKQAI